MIRPPDDYKMERLANNTQSYNSLKNITYDDQMKIAIEVSRQEYSDELEELEEQQVLESYQEECRKREEKTNPILNKLKRVSKYDKEIESLLLILNETFNNYNKGYINFQYFEDDIKKNIWKHLFQIRFTVEEKEFLENILK